MDLISIGAFARLSGLTVRAVRHYGELGLLEPAEVDSETGYRKYELDQVAEATVIRRLRSLGVSLDDIGRILEAHDEAYTRSLLIEHRAKVAERAATTEQILTTLQRLIEGEEDLMPTTVDIRGDIEVKDIPEQHVLVIRERAPLERLSDVIPAAFQEIASYLKELGLEPVGAPTTICPYADEAGIVGVENAWTVDGPVPGRGRIEATTLPGCTAVTYEHRGHYNELDRSYRALEALVADEALSKAGEPREIYWTNPNELPPEQWVTEIQFPIVNDAAAIALRAAART